MPETKLLSLEKTREKLKATLERHSDGRRVRISAKLAKSIEEHLYRLADLDD